MTGPVAVWHRLGAWASARVPARHRRVLVYLVVVGVAAWGLLRQQAQADEQGRASDRQSQTINELHALIEAEEAEERVEAADRCVTSWEVREQIRQSDEGHGRAGGEALIEVVQPDDPVIVELYRSVLTEKLRAASDEVEDPTCDLAAARAVLEEPPLPPSPPATPAPPPPGGTTTTGGP